LPVNASHFLETHGVTSACEGQMKMTSTIHRIINLACSLGHWQMYLSSVQMKDLQICRKKKKAEEKKKKRTWLAGNSTFIKLIERPSNMKMLLMGHLARFWIDWKCNLMFCVPQIVDCLLLVILNLATPLANPFT